MVLALAIVPGIVNAAQITDRKFTLSNSNGGASGVGYVFDSSALPTGTAVRSVKAEACTTASGACSTPSGFTGASANLTAQPTGLGATSSWADDSNAGNLRITHASNVTAPSGAVNIQWDTVTNPTADNTTFYLRVTTYSDAAYSSALDSGTVAVSTGDQITVSATVDETLTFCAGTSGITNSSCAGATGSTVSLGSITPSTTGSGTSQIGISTNATSGYSITVSGSTLTSGGNTISALASQTASSQGSEQFGINLRDNATPNVGTDPDGSGSATPTSNYNTADQYRFVSGDSIASKGSSDNFRRYHVSYVANVAGSTEAGSYSTNLNFVATATF
jgi:hypothetical protein